MEENQVVNDVVQKQATVGEILHDYMYGMSPYQIAEKYGLASETVTRIVVDADAKGKFIPKGATASLDDKVTETPEPLVEGENPEPQKPKK